MGGYDIDKDHPDPFDPYYDEGRDFGPSRSQKKREAVALRKLGEELIKLDQNQLKQLNLPAELFDAICEARRISNKHAAFKRQRQFIGKLMRDLDAAPIETAVEAIHARGNAQTGKFHHIERWRDRLLAEGDAALSDLLADYPEADSRHIRQLLRNAAKESERGQPPKSARALFQYLRTLFNEF